MKRLAEKIEIKVLALQVALLHVYVMVGIGVLHTILRRHIVDEEGEFGPPGTCIVCGAVRDNV